MAVCSGAMLLPHGDDQCRSDHRPDRHLLRGRTGSAGILHRFGDEISNGGDLLAARRDGCQPSAGAQGWTAYLAANPWPAGRARAPRRSPLNGTCGAPMAQLNVRPVTKIVGSRCGEMPPLKMLRAQPVATTRSALSLHRLLPQTATDDHGHPWMNPKMRPVHIVYVDGVGPTSCWGAWPTGLVSSSKPQSLLA